MSKRPNNLQLDLNLNVEPSLSGKHAEKPFPPQGSASVVTFVDAGAMRLRQDAVRRIAASGIFALHPNLHKKLTDR